MYTTSKESLQFLFPVPSFAPSRLAPAHSPGVSPQSTEALLEVLKDNHAKWHIFFNEQRFHNHAPHRSLAAWCLGADADAIRAGYKKDCGYEKPAFDSPSAVTWDNFNDHLGDDQYFSAYMHFFATYIKEKGLPAALEEFIFSSKANRGSTSTSGAKPQMLNRFLSGVIHPLIHTGYGAEFGLPGMAVEGLAEAAVHEAKPFIEPLNLFEDEALSSRIASVNLSDKVEAVVNTLLPQPLVGDQQPLSSATKKHKDTDPHALTILARVLRDPRFRPCPAGDNNRTLEHVLKEHGEHIAAYVLEWSLEEKRMQETELWERKVEEIVWCIIVLYGVAGWVDGKDRESGFNSDFFLMHLVTSSAFIPSFCALLTPQSRVRLLKAYFFATCAWAVARGQPKIDIEGFMKATQNPEKAIPRPSSDAPETTSGNAWDRLLQEARIHPDEHLTKTIRSLANWGSHFGVKKARIPLPVGIKQANTAPKGLVIDSSSSNDKIFKRGTHEGEVIAEDPDLSPRAWREWKNGTLPGSPPRSPPGTRTVMPVVHNGSPTTHSIHVHRRNPSEDADLSPRAWREAVNHGLMDVQGHEIPEMDLGEPLHAHGSRRYLEECLPKTELEGSEYLDGTLFLRVAVLAMQRAGWSVDEGRDEEVKVLARPEEQAWDFIGFYDQHDSEKANAQN